MFMTKTVLRIREYGEYCRTSQGFHDAEELATLQDSLQ